LREAQGFESPAPGCGGAAVALLDSRMARPEGQPAVELTRKDTNMPSVNDMYPSKWLKASDCEDGDMVLTISGIVQERIGQGSQADDKWVLNFEEEEKGLVLNKTNTNTIAKLYGNDTDDWIGKQVTLFATEVQFQGDMVEAIRVRSKPPRKPGAKVTKPVTAKVEEVAEEAEGDIPF
jgi:hypothetical protein